MLELKQKITDYLISCIDEKISALKDHINGINESISNETKSSVGDKYETGRAMLQIEKDQISAQLANALEQKAILSSTDIVSVKKTISPGSLIFTNTANYFLAIGFGKIHVDGMEFIVLSHLSPLGKAFLGLSEKDISTFNGIDHRIEKIV